MKQGTVRFQHELNFKQYLLDGGLSEDLLRMKRFNKNWATSRYPFNTTLYKYSDFIAHATRLMILYILILSPASLLRSFSRAVCQQQWLWP